MVSAIHHTFEPNHSNYFFPPELGQKFPRPLPKKCRQTAEKVEEASCLSSIYQDIVQIPMHLRRNVLYGTYSLGTPIVMSAGQGTVSFVQFAGDLMRALPSSKPSTGSSSLGVHLSPDTVAILGKGRLWATAAAVPAALISIGDEASTIAIEVRKGRSEEAIDAGLRLTAGVSTLCDNISSLASGLAMSGAVESVSHWATPLGIVSAGLSSVSIALNIRNMNQTKRTLRKLSHLDGSRWLEREIKNSKADGAVFINRYFGIINYEKYASQILHILNRDCDTPIEQAAKDEMMGALKIRLKGKIESHKVAIVASIIGLIGVIILFFPILGPAFLGVGLIGLSAFFSFCKFVGDKRSVRQLEEVLDKLCDFDAIPYDTLPDYGKDLHRYLHKPYRYEPLRPGLDELASRTG